MLSVPFISYTNAASLTSSKQTVPRTTSKTFSDTKADIKAGIMLNRGRCRPAQENTLATTATFPRMLLVILSKSKWIKVPKSEHRNLNGIMTWHLLIYCENSQQLQAAGSAPRHLNTLWVGVWTRKHLLRMVLRVPNTQSPDIWRIWMSRLRRSEPEDSTKEKDLMIPCSPSVKV